ncbi:hypothetical protein HAX54_028528, partial [Datura stramonium]|nr:hypothetical protein [Datura stramonium]
TQPIPPPAVLVTSSSTTQEQVPAQTSAQIAVQAPEVDKGKAPTLETPPTGVVLSTFEVGALTTIRPFPAADSRNSVKWVLRVWLIGQTVFQKDGLSIEGWTKAWQNGISKGRSVS